MREFRAVEHSTQYTRALQATENAWQEMAAEFGLLTDTEVAAAVSDASASAHFASDERAAGRLLAVERPEGLRYPGFQIDRSRRIIRPVIEELLAIAGAAGRSEASLALWLAAAATGYLDGARPVDRLDNPVAVVEAASQAFNVAW
ncbi:hypothetical protein [Pseudarthrobacter phenanthrenivorans]|uniref:Uncharacterized protein n=1 Tax=Pseudarthrobacter phenanthrenivorans TaxID=361575 RepID=A0A0B4DW62_PSEPS|nr:hypothetical protein [Pseudarthrobacter phenanthrenivorans]KIC68690.1 hypothetical protein RM50_04295 [Pseudarthrobacter phenanthrenivorans]